MKKHTIYLAGPISGCSYDGCTSWREAFKTHMPDSVQCLSPMRGKDYLDQEQVIDGSYPNHVLSCSRGIMTRDYFDCTRADIVVVNLLGAPRVSIGTVMEIAWAYTRHTPTIVMMEKEANVHEHPMIAEAIGFRVETMEQAAHVAKVILFDPAELRDFNAYQARSEQIHA
jgi:nucleoside 2-deoxyribosyltransferase